MGLGDEYELDTVEEETRNRARYEAVTDAEEPETQMEQDLQPLHDYLADTEDGEIKAPEKYKTLIGPVGAGKTRRNGITSEHGLPETHRIHTPKDRTKSLRKRLTDTENEALAFRGHYHTPGWFRG